MGYHMMEYMGRLVRKTGVAVVMALLMLVLMGQAQSRRSLAAAMGGALDVGPWSEEFSLSRDGASAGLGVQEGAFPWGTGLSVKQVNFWRESGTDYFEITGTDGTMFEGVRQDGTADTRNGLLLGIRTDNPDWRTLRGVSVGMSMEDVLALYPEARAEYDGHREAGTYRYTYSGTRDSAAGVSHIAFSFQESTLTAIDIYHTAE